MENYLSLSPRCYIFFLKLIWLFFFFDFSTESIQSTSSTTSSISCSDNRCFEFVLNPDGVLLLQTFAQVSVSTTTTSTGRLLRDVFHLITEDEDLKRC